jgi:hypothetical protein
MAPTAAMLILGHHGKSTSPPSHDQLPPPPPPPPATFLGFKLAALKWVSEENPICKPRSSDDKQKHGKVDPSFALEKSFEDALQFSCW